VQALFPERIRSFLQHRQKTPKVKLRTEKLSAACWELLLLAGMIPEKSFQHKLSGKMAMDMTEK
jgi:hypothetical protein